MTERRRFLRSGIILTAVALLMRTVGMFFGAFISGAVGTEGVGLYTIVMTVYSFAVTFATSGIGLTTTRLVAEAEAEAGGRTQSVLRSALLYAAVFGTASSVILFFGADVIGALILSDTRSALSLKILSFSLLPIALGSVFSGYFVGVKRVSFNAVLQVLSQAAKIALTVILVIKFSPLGISAAVAALSLGSVITEIFAALLIYAEYLYDRRKNGSARDLRLSEIKNVTKTALPIAASTYVRSALLTLEHILIPKRLIYRGENSSEAYSNYGLLGGMAIPTVTYPMSPLSSFASLLVPEFAGGVTERAKRRLSRIASEALSKTLAYAIVVSSLMYFFSEELGYVIYSSYDVGRYIRVLAPVIPIMYLDHVTDAMLKGIGEQVFSMWVNITDSLLSVILVWFLIPRMGIMGYALVIVIMEGYNFLLSFIRLRGRVHFSVDLKGSALIPALASLLSALLSKRLFRFGGSTVSAVWLVLEMLFSLSVTLFLISLTKIKFKKKSNA